MRLMLLAHGETGRTRELAFGDVSDLVAGRRPADATRQLPVTWWSAPEPACRQTAELFSVEPAGVIDELAGPDAGRWRGRSLAEVMADEPAALQRWLVDPFASPHGGESLADLVERIGRALDGAVPIGKAQPPRWTKEGATLVVAPLVARAAVVHALGAPPASIFHVDVAPLGIVRLGRQAGRWRLSGLGRADRS